MTTRNYEAMFILDNNAASADFEGTAGKVDEILQKHGATLVQKEKWDERKLAYEIKGHRRGTYYLVYFEAPPTAIDAVNEDIRLAEVVLRHLVIALDLPIDEHIAKIDAERELLAEDSRKNALGGWGGSGPRRGARAPERRGERPRTDNAPAPAPAAGAESATGQAAPPASEQPAAGSAPATSEEPAAGSAPATGKEPAADSAPATGEEPAAGSAPATSEKPAADPASSGNGESGESEESKSKEAAPQP